MNNVDDFRNNKNMNYVLMVYQYNSLSVYHWLHEAEKTTKYFLALESKNYVDKTIKKL